MKRIFNTYLKKAMALVVVLAVILSLSACENTGSELVGKAPIKLNTGERAYYISNDGDDSNDGSFQKPFLTFSKAQEKLRAAAVGMQGNLYIIFRGGTYSESITLTDKDSGRNGYNVVIMSYPKEEAVISGGQRVVGFKKVKNKPYYSVKLSDISSVRQFYANGVFQPRSSSVTRILPEDWLYSGANRNGFKIKTEYLEGISETDGLEMRLSYEWQEFLLPVKGIRQLSEDMSAVYMSDKIKEKYIQMVDNSTAITSGHKLELFLENSVDLIDEPGEWAFDTKDKILYYYPAEDIDIKNAVFEIPVKQQLLSVSGSSTSKKANNINIKGLNFRLGAWDYVTENGFISWQADAYWESITEYPDVKYGIIDGNISIKNANSVVFSDNKFNNLGATAINASSGVSNCTIEKNAFFDCAAGAVTIGNNYQRLISTSDTDNQLCDSISINNNSVYNIGQSYYSVIGILAYYGSNISITDNDIMYVPNSGISVGWGSWHEETGSFSTNNAISNNRVMFHSQSSRDSGGIYTLDKQPNSVINNNYIKDNGYNAKGIYHDTGTQDFTDSLNVLDMKESGYWTNDYASTTKNITYNNNYTSIERHVNMSGSVHNNTVYVLDKNWPLEARNIILNSGVKPENGTVRAKSLGIEKNIALWLSADSSVGTDSSKNLTSWSDYSGNSVATTVNGSPLWCGYTSNENHGVEFTSNDSIAFDKIISSDEFAVVFNCTISEEMTVERLLSAVGISASTPEKTYGSLNKNKNSCYRFTIKDGVAEFHQNGVLIAEWNSNLPTASNNMKIGSDDFTLFEILYYDGINEKTVKKAEKYLIDKYYIDTVTQENLMLWLDAENLVTTKDGKVIKWGDSSKNKIGGLVQLKTDNAPEYIENGINGKPSLKFDGVNDFMLNFSSRWIGEEITAFVVMQLENAESPQGFGAVEGISKFLTEINSDGCVSVGGNYPNRVSTQSNAFEFSKRQLFVYQRYPIFENVSPSTQVWLTELPAVINIWNGNTKIGQYSNNAKKSDIEWGGFKLGNQSDNTLKGLVSEVLIYNRKLNENEHNIIYDYLNQKYALN